MAAENKNIRLKSNMTFASFAGHRLEAAGLVPAQGLRWSCLIGPPRSSSTVPMEKQEAIE